MHHLQHAAMATTFDVRCTHDDARYARQACRFAFDTVDRIERQLSRFVENSDISRINHLSAGEDTPVGIETMQCLQVARLAFEETEGAFDVSLGTGFERLELLPAEHRVRALSAGVQIDLGGIGKGYAVDRVVESLEDWEVARALVDAGRSSVVALEPPDGSEAWALSLSLPDAPGDPPFARIPACQRVLGASGIARGDHIVDPRTAQPVRHRAAAWVSAPRHVLAEICRRSGTVASPAALADALSTAFMIMPPERIERYRQAHPGVEAWILDGDLLHFEAMTAPAAEPAAGR